jgi:hypothetical protein
VVKEFSQIDLHPDVVSNQEMNYIFEELIRRFSENAEAGFKAVLMGLAERYESADYCYSGKKKEADASLRDTESIPHRLPAIRCIGTISKLRFIFRISCAGNCIATITSFLI